MYLDLNADVMTVLVQYQKRILSRPIQDLPAGKRQTLLRYSEMLGIADLSNELVELQCKQHQEQEAIRTCIGAVLTCLTKLQPQMRPLAACLSAVLSSSSDGAARDSERERVSISGISKMRAHQRSPMLAVTFVGEQRDAALGRCRCRRQCPYPVPNA